MHRTTVEQPEEVSRYCLPVFQARPRSDGSEEQWLEGDSHDRSGETEEQWLRAAFAPQAPPPPRNTSKPFTPLRYMIKPALHLGIVSH